MKIGDKIVCVNYANISDIILALLFEKIPNKKDIYTIRGITEIEGITAVFLEEIVNPITPCCGREHPFPIVWFRKVEEINALDELKANEAVDELFEEI